MNRPLRIAMVVASPFPANHGTPGSVREMAEAVAAARHHVHIVTYPFGEGRLPQGVTLHRVKAGGFSRRIVVGPTWYKPFLDLGMVWRLCRVIRREGIDLIHGHNYEGALIGAVARLVTRRPLVYHAINTMRDELPSYGFFHPRLVAVWLARCLDFVVPRLADRIIAISDELMAFLKAQRVAPERCQMIPLGINLAPFEHAAAGTIRHDLQLGPGPVFVYTGILDPFQRIDYLLKAMRMVVAKQPDAHLLLVSNLARPDDVQRCRTLIAALALQAHVTLLPECPFEVMANYLAAADIAVLSRPRCPGFPVKLLNYMAAAKPIVLFAGSAKGLIHGKQAFVVPDDDWQALAEGMLTLARQPALAHMLGAAARRCVEEKFVWPALVQRIERVYCAALGETCQGAARAYHEA